MFFKDIPVSKIMDKVRKSTLLNHISIVVLRHEPRTVDVLWGQLHRSIDGLSKQISKAGFNVLRTSAASDEDSTSAFIFLLDSLVLPKSQIKMGPNVNMKGEVSKFLDSNLKWSKLTWAGNDQRIYIMGDRRFLAVEELLYSLLDDTAKGSGVAPGLKRALESRIEVISGKNIAKSTSGRQWLIEALYRVVITDEFSFS